MTMRCNGKSIKIYPGHKKTGFSWILIQMKINPVQNHEDMKDLTTDNADSQTTHMRAKRN